jgi:microtubule-associated protein-like 6
VHVDPKHGTFIGAGTSAGVLAIYVLDVIKPKSDRFVVDPNAVPNYNMTQLASRKDSHSDLSDVKFSPESNMIATGSHDDVIDIYSVDLSLRDIYKLIDPSCALKPLRRLRGHHTYITHLDWSADSSLLQSTCGAYEILRWDVESGKQLRSDKSLESDVDWHTYTCTLGFPVMGIWPKYSDGTDINSLDVSFEKNIVATADDFQHINIMNYPCVVKEAPRVTSVGHGSHVMNIRFLGKAAEFVVSVGGNDCAALSWRIARDPVKEERRKCNFGNFGG